MDPAEPGVVDPAGPGALAQDPACGSGTTSSTERMKLFGKNGKENYGSNSTKPDGESMQEMSAMDELATLFLDYLPGPGPGYPISPASFQGIARELDLQKHWRGHMKEHSIKSLLEGTMKECPEKFPLLIEKIVEHSSSLRSQRHSFSQMELEQIRACLRKLNLAVEKLESQDYFNSLPRGESAARPTEALQKLPMADLHSRMRKELIDLTLMAESERNYALELFLNKLFANSDLRQIAPFRLQQTEVTGKFKFGKEAAALHALWQADCDRNKIREILESAQEELCIIICLPSFDEDTREFFAKNSISNLLGIDLRDIFLVLDGGANLEQMIGLKLQAAAKGKSFVLTQELLYG